MPRKQKKYHYIYKTTCVVNEKYYYGMHSTDNLEDGYIGSGKRLWYSINKHGRENHVMEILEFCENRSSLKLREKELVDEDLLKDPMCMNLVRGGEGGIFNKHHHLKMRNGASKWMIEMHKDEDFFKKNREVNSNRFKKLHAEGKFKYDNFKGKSHSEETKRKIGEANSKSQKGSKNSQYGTCWIHNEKKNKKIEKEELKFYLESGWNKGRKMKI